jgi:hypothetical protein
MRVRRTAVAVLAAVAAAAGAAACGGGAGSPRPTDRLLLRTALPPPAAFERVLAATRSLGYVTDEIDERRSYLRVYAKSHRDGAAPGFWGSLAPGRPAHLHVQVFADGSVGIRAECEHIAHAEPIPDELLDELVAYGREVRAALGPEAPAPAPHR